MPQWIATTQFYLYGREYCTKTGYDNAVANRKGNDILQAGITYPEKIYIVTGSNSGIGKEVATYLAKQQSTVYMFCRNTTKAEKAKEEIAQESNNEKVYVIQCDCSLESDVRRAYAEFVDHSGGERLDCLVTNAGVLLNKPQNTKEGVEVTFACHLLFGTYLLGELAIPLMEKTEDSRLVSISSGGMYNTKFPDFNIATSRKGTYNGQLAYSYAKRGQVLLCEEWAKLHPKIKFATCHPGWTRTDAVDEAFGDNAKYLEPMRNTWEGAEGIIWLCVIPGEAIQSGEFYLDRLVCRKHLGGPFFTDGSYTKNTAEEVEIMMTKLKRWSCAESRPEPVAFNKQSPLNSALTPSEKKLDISKFMGVWHVWGVIPTRFEPVGLRNPIERYMWNDDLKCVDISFEYFKVNDDKKPVITKQRGFMDTDTNTQWSLKINAFASVYIPVPIKYLIVDFDDNYEHCIVSVPNRDYVWIMSKNQDVNEEIYNKMVVKVDGFGIDTSKIIRPEHNKSLTK